jgi:hypothetical protein
VETLIERLTCLGLTVLSSMFISVLLATGGGEQTLYNLYVLDAAGT